MFLFGFMRSDLSDHERVYQVENVSRGQVVPPFIRLCPGDVRPPQQPPSTLVAQSFQVVDRITPRPRGAQDNLALLFFRQPLHTQMRCGGRVALCGHPYPSPTCFEHGRCITVLPWSIQASRGLIMLFHSLNCSAQRTGLALLTTAPNGNYCCHECIGCFTDTSPRIPLGNSVPVSCRTRTSKEIADLVFISLFIACSSPRSAACSASQPAHRSRTSGPRSWRAANLSR